MPFQKQMLEIWKISYLQKGTCSFRWTKNFSYLQKGTCSCRWTFDFRFGGGWVGGAGVRSRREFEVEWLWLQFPRLLYVTADPAFTSRWGKKLPGVYWSHSHHIRGCFNPPNPTIASKQITYDRVTPHMPLLRVVCNDGWLIKMEIAQFTVTLWERKLGEGHSDWNLGIKLSSYRQNLVQFHEHDHKFTGIRLTTLLEYNRWRI